MILRRRPQTLLFLAQWRHQLHWIRWCPCPRISSRSLPVQRPSNSVLVWICFWEDFWHFLCNFVFLLKLFWSRKAALPAGPQSQLTSCKYNTTTNYPTSETLGHFSWYFHDFECFMIKISLDGKSFFVLRECGGVKSKFTSDFIYVLSFWREFRWCLL